MVLPLLVCLLVSELCSAGGSGAIGVLMSPSSTGRIGTAGIEFPRNLDGQEDVLAYFSLAVMETLMLWGAS